MSRTSASTWEAPSRGRPDGRREGPLARTFRTRRPRDPAGFVRTFGTVLEAPGGVPGFGEAEAISSARGTPPPRCAFGKVVALSPDERGLEASCHQLSGCGGRARLVGCCNGVAAAVALHALAREADGEGGDGRPAPGAAPGGTRVDLRVALPGPRRVEGAAHVARLVDGIGFAVRQSWRRVPYAIRRVPGRAGRAGILCEGALNDYLVEVLEPGEDPAAVPLDEPLDHFRRLGLERDPLRSRLALVAPAQGGAPRARFVTCEGREHPSAPMTGLAVLAIAAASLGWPDAGAVRRVETPGGAMSLPRVRARGDGTADIAFGRIVVSLGGTA